MLHDLSSMPKLKDISIPGLTADGRNWLTLALDPFHDRVIKQAGLPDKSVFPSTCEVFSQTYNLVAPAGTVGNWSAHIFSLPMMALASQFGIACAPAQRLFGNITTQVTDSTGAGVVNCNNTMGAYMADNLLPDVGLSFFNIHAWNTDVNTMFPDGSGAWSRPQTVQPIGASGFLMQRVVGAGIEVVNTTAALYQQGGCTVSRVPSTTAEENSNCWQTADGSVESIFDPGFVRRGDVSSRYFRTAYGPPATLESAMAYPGTKTWRAAEGCYSVIALDLTDSDFKQPEFTGRAFQSTAVTTPYVFGGPLAPFALASPTKSFVTGASTGAINNLLVTPSIDVSSDVSSIMLTGLSPQSTFTVTVRWIVEKAPRVEDPGGPDLVRLTSPAAAYDHLALRAYMHLASQMPVGVPSRFNPLGEYWNYIVNMVAKAAPVISKVAGMIPLPGASIVSRVADIAGRAAAAASAATSAAKAVQKVVAKKTSKAVVKKR
jgi:hypothetical protein